MREQGINLSSSKKLHLYSTTRSIRRNPLQMCPSRVFTVVLYPTAVTQTEENSLGVENNSCRDQQVPNSLPHQSQNPCSAGGQALDFFLFFNFWCHFSNVCKSMCMPRPSNAHLESFTFFLRWQRNVIKMVAGTKVSSYLF